MGRLESLARGLLKPINPYVTALLGLLTLTWGLWVLSPFWDVFTSALVYHHALRLAPEWAWGTWATLCGAVLLLALYGGRTRTLMWALAFASWHWCTVSYMFFWGDWHNTAGIAYFWVGVYSIYCYLNIKVNYVGAGKHKV